MTLFRSPRGVIPACDFHEIDKFESLVKDTCNINGIVAYKVGFALGLRHGLAKLVNIAGEYTDLPIIYDHQKGGTDIPEMGELFAVTCAEAGIQGVIIFPQSGPKTEESYINALKDENLIPIVGGEMTHPKFLEVDGGFIRDAAPRQIYEIAAKMGVDHFVLPGNNPNSIIKYHRIISEIIMQPKYCMPGIGRQGGKISADLALFKKSQLYAIVGSGIYSQEDMHKAAEGFCTQMLSEVN